MQSCMTGAELKRHPPVGPTGALMAALLGCSKAGAAVVGGQRGGSPITDSYTCPDGGLQGFHEETNEKPPARTILDGRQSSGCNSGMPEVCPGLPPTGTRMQPKRLDYVSKHIGTGNALIECESDERYESSRPHPRLEGGSRSRRVSCRRFNDCDHSALREMPSFIRPPAEEKLSGRRIPDCSCERLRTKSNSRAWLIPMLVLSCPLSLATALRYTKTKTRLRTMMTTSGQRAIRARRHRAGICRCTRGMRRLAHQSPPLQEPVNLRQGGREALRVVRGAKPSSR